MSEKNPLDYRGNPLSDFEVYLLFDGVSTNLGDDVQVAGNALRRFLTHFFASGNGFAARGVLSAFLALAATAKPSPWSVDARNAQEFCSASPVPDQ
ncbi:hypothetical protein KGF30_005167 [Escherichia coli]|nr:hypothetical protein [Escherichia coli]EER2118066.1 hypothetical protein [Escherichia coli]EFD3994231.1 hypothetical protein [Escherichia coli]EHM3960770.1 hypothetical protein [Escherichia coli]EIO7587618.1 hypothetical protein [Escherichia coli]